VKGTWERKIKWCVTVLFVLQNMIWWWVWGLISKNLNFIRSIFGTRTNLCGHIQCSVYPFSSILVISHMLTLPLFPNLLLAYFIGGFKILHHASCSLHSPYPPIQRLYSIIMDLSFPYIYFWVLLGTC
jgi:hypothetical protein